MLGTGVHALLTDWNKVITAAGGLSLIALGVYTAKGATGVTARYIEARLGNVQMNPQLNTNKLSIFQQVNLLWLERRRAFRFWMRLNILYNNYKK